MTCDTGKYGGRTEEEEYVSTSSSAYRVVIDYACLVDGSETLHLLRPGVASSNSNQYVFVFEGARDWSVLCLSGDWEYEALLQCMQMAGDKLSDEKSARFMRFGVGGLARTRALKQSSMVGAEILVEKMLDGGGNLSGKLVIRLDTDAQLPFIRPSRHGVETRSLRLNRTNSELASLGRLFHRLESETSEAVFESLIDHWFMPHNLSFCSGVELLAMEERVKSCIAHVSQVSPGGLVGFWIAALSELYVPVAARCPSCDGFFPRAIDEKWRKLCLGCYRGDRPYSFTQSEIESAAVVKPWLKALTSSDGVDGTGEFCWGEKSEAERF